MWHRSLLVLAFGLFAGNAQAGLDDYGVVVGTVSSHFLETPAGQGKWPHYVVNVATPQGNYRAVINLFSRLDEQVMHREVAIAPFADYRGIFSLPSGLTHLPFNTSANASTAGALDYARHPALLKDIADTPWNSWPLIVNVTTVPVLQNLLAGAKKVYIFGEPYANSDGTKGIHDVHQNQGNPYGAQFWQLNGVHQDGGMIIEYEPTRWWMPRICGVVPPCWGGYYLYFPNRTLVMTRFQAQRDFTDASGHGVVPTTSTVNGATAANTYVDYGPFNAGQIQVEVTTTSGNPDVYLQLGATATESSYRNVSKETGSANEFLRDNTGGMTYLRVKANGAASSWSITTRWLPPSP